MSTDGGNVWTAIYTRGGAYTYAAGATYSSASWDSGWSLRSVPLAAWAGKPLRLRFILRPGSISFDGPDINHGCYLDDISLTNVRRLTSGLPQTVTSTGFQLDTQLVGAALLPGKTYLIRVRPSIGNRVMGFTGSFTAVPRQPTGFEAAFPLLSTAPTLDTDADGVPNLLEYALGLNPLDASAAALPPAVLTPEGLTMSFNVPAGVSDIQYTAECTSDFQTWQPVANQGTGPARVFRIPVTPGTNCFMRLRVNQVVP